jgi:hypothetical protein
MGIKSERETYVVLEKYLRKAESPLTCTDLLDIPEVRTVAIQDFGDDQRRRTDQVSNALGLMWKHNLITRYPAIGKGLAKYAYIWADNKPKAPALPPSLLSSKKTGVTIVEEDGGVRIEFDKFTVFVKSK